MYIDLTEFILNEQELFFKKSDVVNLENEDDLRFNGPVNYDLLISKAGNELILNIDFDYSYVKPCDRCLSDVENYQESSHMAKLIRNESEDSDDMDTWMLENNKLDIDEFVRQLTFLSIPTKTLCDDNCKGLCPICGQNLNESECDCKKDNIDMRFSVLKDIKISEEV